MQTTTSASQITTSRLLPVPLKYDPRVHAMRLWLDAALDGAILSRRVGLDVELYRLQRMRRRVDDGLWDVAWAAVSLGLALVASSLVWVAWAPG